MSATMGFPRGPVVKNPPANGGDMGLIPGWGQRATGPLSPWATTTEAHTPRARALQQQKPLQWLHNTTRE